MPGMLEYSMGELGRVGLLEVFRVEAENYPDHVGILCGDIIKTKQSYEKIKSLIGLGLPNITNEGDVVQTDTVSSLFTGNFYPYKVAMAVEYSHELEYVDQYRQVLELQAQLASTFKAKRNYVAASLDNLGFTATNLGLPPNESLYQTNHANGTSPFSNVPSTSLPFGPLAIAQMRSDMHQQLSARGVVMPYNGTIVVTYPYALEGRSFAMAESERIPTSNNNDKNFARVKFEYVMIDEYSSPTAWFGRYKPKDKQGKFFLEQMPYDIVKLPMDKRMMHTYICWEKYCPGWKDAHGTYASPGI